MPKLNVAPTKTNLLLLRGRLEFAEEGYDLLEEKRQILVLELMRRIARADELERRVAEALGPAFAALREATLDIGSQALDAASLGVRTDHRVILETQHVAGVRVPRVTARLGPPGHPFGVGGTSANVDLAQQRFAALVPLLAEMAELDSAVRRLARELRRTQRRCNALTKILIPNHRATIKYIAGELEEREREDFVIHKLIRDRLAASGEG